MTKQYAIHPKMGVARLGNSQKAFYLGPEKTGGLPIRCDLDGNPILDNGLEQPVNRFKDKTGAIKRQAARFKIFVYEDGSSEGREISINDSDIAGIKWTAHIANKKAVWYNFSELQGDLTFGEYNSYENQHIPLRNSDIQGKERQKYIIDPGPRSVAQPGQKAKFSYYNMPADYPDASFPQNARQYANITSLGEIMMDSQGRLVLLGGFGNSGGPGDISSFAGANGWFDDISDGYVLATINFKDGSSIDLEPAWVIIGSPKYAPELVNIITLDDCIFDTAVRGQNYNAELYDKSKYPNTYAPAGGGYNPFVGFNPDYCPNYKRDIEPIIVRPQSYRWVANVPSMIDFSRPNFNTADASDANKANREEYFDFYRIPVPPGSQEYLNIENGPTQLFHKSGLPLMPLNSGDNSVLDFHLVYKFLTLTPTQYFFMKQWSLGKFTTGEAPPDNQHGVTDLDRQVIGNCVGGPFSPGIEVTWIVRNPATYSSPYQVKVAHWSGSNTGLEAYYAANGLSTTSDPQDGNGTEPGDLTKRMAIPWQADFFDCTVQTPNITIPDINQSPADDGIQIPPAYYVYWWPPQSPMNVIAGSLEPGDQILDGYVTYPPVAQVSSGLSYQINSNYQIVAAGQQVLYSRGVSSFNQMVASWKDLGFILNTGTDRYPYFVEKERNTTFMAQGVPLGSK
jgi:L-lysine 6-oxidase